MITLLGYQHLKSNLSELKHELQRVLEERAKAAAEGDLKENSAYLFYGERAEVLRSQINQLNSDLKSVRIMSPPTHTNTITFGHEVKILFESDNREMTLTLVGKHDSALNPSWISIDSPLGLALLGKSESDRVNVNGQSVLILSVSIGKI